MHPYPRAIPTESPRYPSRHRDHALASPGHLVPMAASIRCAGATMHLDDAVLRRASTTLRRTVTMSVRMPRPLRALAPTFRPLRRDHASHPRDGALDKPIVRRTDATIRLHSPVPPSHDRVPRPKGTGHAPRGCRWSGLSPRPTSALPQLGPGRELPIAAGASWTGAWFSPSGSTFCASSRRSSHSPQYPRANARRAPPSRRRGELPRRRGASHRRMGLSLPVPRQLAACPGHPRRPATARISTTQRQARHPQHGRLSVLRADGQ
jgi:hypothetical protein